MLNTYRPVIELEILFRLAGKVPFYAFWPKLILF